MSGEGFSPLVASLMPVLTSAARVYVTDEPIEPVDHSWRSSAWIHAIKRDFVGPDSQIGKIEDLIESPLEYAAFAYLEGCEFSRPLEVFRPEQELPERHGFFIQPQYKADCYRLDFLLTFRGAIDTRRIALELDGAAFHTNKKKDAERDSYLIQRHRIMTIRVTGKRIFGNIENAFADAVYELGLWCDMSRGHYG